MEFAQPVCGVRVGGALAVRREERREKPCVTSVMLGQSHGSMLQQNSLRKSRASSLLGELQGTVREGSLLGELQGTVREGWHRPTALQPDKHVPCVYISL